MGVAQKVWDRIARAKSIGATSLSLGFSELSSASDLDAVFSRLSQLPKLTTLDLSANDLSSIPESIGTLTGLTDLRLSYNKLSSVPESLGNLTNLSYLRLNDNTLSSIPESIGTLTGLTDLRLSYNKLSSVPESIGTLTGLTSLDLYKNSLTSVPESIVNLTQLTFLDLRGNSLNLPPELAGELDSRVGVERFFDYLRQLYKKEGTRPLNEAKVILVGEAKTGKTSLVKRLMTGDFDAHEPKTDGIDIHLWNLDGVTFPGSAGANSANEARTIRVNLWDLGGQEIYHATHQFFLTERTLYLLVLSARSTDEQNRLHYWLKTIRALGKDAPILIVHNQYETNPEQLDRKVLREKYPSIAPNGFLETSCQDNEGIEALNEAIQRELGRMRHVADPLPASYFAVKEKLEQVTQQNDFLSATEYSLLCRSVEVTDKKLRDAILRLLHALGTVVSFQDDLSLRDTNVLNPEWVTEGVYSVLDDPDVKKAGDGILTTSALSTILRGAKKTYPDDKHPYILEMMVKFQLCFPRPGVPGEYLVPELLHKSEPDEVGDFTDALRLELHYDFLPQSVLPRFIVLTSHLLQPYRWRKGVVLEEKGNRALIRADSEANKVTIAVSGQASTRRDFLSVIRDHFAQICRIPETLTVEEYIPLADYPKANPIPYRHLLQLEGFGDKDFRWTDVPEKLKVADLLKGIETHRHVKVETVPKPIKRPTNDELPLTRTDFLERTEVLSVAPENAQYLNELLDQIEKKRVVPFVGAGLTIPLGLPGWGNALQTIFDNAKPSLGVDDAVRYATAKAKNEWEEAAQALWEVPTLGERWFNEQIKSLFGKYRLPDPIGGAIALLPRFASGPVLTTNFDRALETVYADAGQPFDREQTVLGDYRASEMVDRWDDGERFLLKLHGDADESAGRVLTKKQYDHAYSTESKLPALLRALFGSRRPLLFLGCSLETDRTLNELRAAGLNDDNARHFALLEVPATPPERIARQNDLIARYGIRPIWFAKGDFAALTRILQSLADFADSKSPHARP